MTFIAVDTPKTVSYVEEKSYNLSRLRTRVAVLISSPRFIPIDYSGRTGRFIFIFNKNRTPSKRNGMNV